MNTNELLKEIFKKLGRFKILILVSGIITALILFFYTKSERPVYTAKATIFPLSNSADNSSSSALNGILGLGDAPKSFSSDAAINIIELTLSRYVREAVALAKLPAFTNKTIAELLISDYNTNRSFSGKPIPLPSDSNSLAAAGAAFLQPGIIAKMSKNGVFEIYFSHPNKSLITPISFVLIEKVSQFYIDLKIKKATADYNFTVRKIDSLDKILGKIDYRAIRMQNTTLFAPDKLEYEIPKEKINVDKLRYTKQRDISLNNQEEALWRLQKLTPIISVLDKPTEPFTVKKSSAITAAFIGFIIGTMVSGLLMVSTLLYQYAQNEIQKNLFGPEVKVPLKS